MGSLFSPGLAVSSRHTVQKRRELPIKGEILVRQGERVTGDTVVARAELEGELRIVRVAESLGVSPEEVHKALRVSIGQQVEAGQTLAEIQGLWGLFRSSVSAPTAGTVEFVSASTGHLGLRAAPKLLTLSAYISGTVFAVEDQRAVVIESEATFVQGIFGVGGEKTGRLKLLDVSPDAAVTEADLPREAQGLVLVGGRSPTPQALAEASKRGAVGFVTGSISGETLRQYLGYDIGIALTGDEAVPMTVIVTEGFGDIAMGERVLATLRAVDGEPASINGATQVRAGAQRPEVIAPASNARAGAEARTREDGAGLRVGARVRIIRVPHFGSAGTVSGMPHNLVKIGTGAWARVLEVTLVNGAVITVPRANVELVE